MKAKRRKTKYCVIAVIGLLALLLAQPVLAVTTTNWIGPSGNWTVISNWDNGVPAAGYNANLTSTTSKTATLNTVTPALNVVTIDGTGGATFTLNQSSFSTALNANIEIIGYDGKGVYNQSSGQNNVASYILLGVNATGNGTYNKSGGSLTTGALQVGNAGTGTFNQSATTVNIGSGVFDPGQPFSLIIGGIYNSGSPLPGIGTYTMSSGNLNVAGGEAVGQAGTGTFTQSSGNHKIGGRLEVGVLGGSTGTFTMSSGTLSVGGFEVIGDVGTGTFIQSSGSHTITGDLDIAKAGGTGTFKMSSGSLSVGGNEYIGHFGGSGSFTQTSGSNTVAGNFIMADQPGTSATYTMTSGSLTVKGPNGEIIGNNGPATFTQTSGSNTAKTITIAANAPATYNLNSGSVTATDPALNAIHIKGPYDGNIPSATGANFNVTGTATVNGNVTNDGLVKTTNANVTWNGVFTNNSAYVSDPGSTQIFTQDLVVNQTGYLVATAPLNAQGKARDKFVLKEDFVITPNNNQSSKWDTHLALLNFNKGTDNIHDLSVAGVNNGKPGKTGGVSNVVTDNYAWGSLDITNQIINLVDANTSVDQGALYVNYLLTGVVISGTTAANINGPSGPGTFNLFIYYNPDVNSYLGGLTYDFKSGKGELRPYHTPLPPSALLLGTGLLGLGALGWRRRKRA